MKIEWNKYTWYSKLLAALFFLLVLPVWSFYLGTVYQDTITSIEQVKENTITDAEIDAYILGKYGTCYPKLKTECKQKSSSLIKNS